ncbi:zinc finger and SCAN domain-containing protein 22-like [Sabethes cyaneus]|uniref:zinc finger and SCAN domain-containing protein 22-like n=1 Tax=Sabethes cyaneus TaxID=53552 RepID=UPI00237D7784|nr:zinc finger and SCAN domain-containing protein 22-like [Sabethes cyaneus]
MTDRLTDFYFDTKSKNMTEPLGSGAGSSTARTSGVDVAQLAFSTVDEQPEVAGSWDYNAFLDDIYGSNPTYGLPTLEPSPEDQCQPEYDLPKLEPSPVAQLQTEYNPLYGISMPETSPEAQSDDAVSTHRDISRSTPLTLSSDFTKNTNKTLENVSLLYPHDVYNDQSYQHYAPSGDIWMVQILLPNVTQGQPEHDPVQVTLPPYLGTPCQERYDAMKKQRTPESSQGTQPESNPVQIVATSKSPPKTAEQPTLTQRGSKKLARKRKFSRVFSDTGIVCTLCKQYFASSGGLKQHNQTNHSGPRQHRCEQCGKRYQSPTKLETHKKRHTAAEKAIGCSECPKRFNHKWDLKRHYDRKHGVLNARYKCSKCGKGFNRRDQGLQHAIGCFTRHSRTRREPKA